MGIALAHEVDHIHLQLLGGSAKVRDCLLQAVPMRVEKA